MVEFSNSIMPNLKEDTDEFLVREVINGDKDKFRVLIQRYEAKLLRYASYLSGNSTLAQDIVQETFIKVYSNLNSFKTSLKFSSWIYRIAHNETVNALKKATPFYFDLDLVSLIVPSKDDIEEDYEKEDTSKRVRLYLDKIPLKYKQVLTLYYLEEKPYDEIGDILRLPLGTVGTLLNRAKKRLKIIVEQEEKHGK